MVIRIPVLLFFLAFSFSQAVGQSLAYKTMLSGIYDKDFPLVYFDQKEILQKAVLLDTREKEEFEVSHLKGARWVGYDTFTMESVKNISKDETIVVYCSVGARSQDMGKRVREAGFREVYNLYGGIFHWVNEGQPIYEDQKPTDRIHAYSRTWGIWVNKGEKVY